MLVSVPQYIDVEDKIVGPLTAKQLGWMFGMGATLLVCYNIFDQSSFIGIAIVVVLIFTALAFYRPNGMTLLNFIGSSISFLFSPKVYVWRRVEEKYAPRITQKEKTGIDQEAAGRQKKKLDFSEVKDFTQVLDSEGMAKNARIEEILRQNSLKKK